MYCNKIYSSINNVQFSTALHILTMLARTRECLSSAYIAGSININAAIVRKSLSALNTGGLIETKEGKGGGATLSKTADRILLSDVYQAVVNTQLLGRFNNPNPECNTGSQINKHLTNLYKEADRALVKQLSTITLADFSKQFS